VNKRSGGATLLIGPAGTGKTTRLFERNVELASAGEQVLFLVGDRRAARALQDRILRALDRSTGEVRVSTWHAFALSILRLGYDRLGERTREPGLLTGPEQYALVREMLSEPDERKRWERFPKQLALAGFVEELREFVLRAQDWMLEPDELARRAENEGRPELVEAARFFRRYLDRLDERNVVDASNAIALTVLLLEQHDDIAQMVRAGTTHVLVDDYHDVTAAQEWLLRALVVQGGTVSVAADPDARIYGFRGALHDAVERFRAHHAPVTEIVCSQVVRPVPERAAWLFDHLTEEADAIARDARRLAAREAIGWGEMAVIVRRYGAASRAIRRSFERAGVPYVLVGENRPLANEPALRPMLDLARAALRPGEREEILPGLLASPIGGLDPYRVRALRRAARLAGTTLGLVLDDPPEDLDKAVRGPLETLRALLEEVARLDREAKRPDEVFWFLWSELEMFRSMVERADQEELDAVSAFARAVERFADRNPDARFGDFLAAVEGVEFGPEPWRRPEQGRPDAVRIMTAHQAVGSEFAAVFVAGCVEGEFPDPSKPRAMLDLDGLLHPATPFERQTRRLAEERRLFDVATSRATVRLVVSAARESSQREAFDPSPFVVHLGLAWDRPAAHIDALTRAEAEATARRALAGSTDDAERADALGLLAALPGVDVDAWWYERDWTDPGIALSEGELHTSYSRLSVYENCPLQYLYQVELGLDPATSHQMLVGTWIHDIVDRCARGEIPKTTDAMEAALDALWDPSIFEGPAIEDRRKRDCRAMLAAWLKADGNLPTLASEVDFAFPVDGALVRGRIDRLVRLGSSMVRVIDYKTGRNDKSDEEIQEDLQLAIYNLAMLRTPELAAHGKPKHLELAWLGTVYGDGNFWRRGLDPTRKEGYAEQTEDKIRSFVEGIKAERFAPSPDADCRWCRFKTLCPVWPAGDEVVL
jgi:superfamily I DNA/RNA helicase/RecB family exonuclease